MSLMEWKYKFERRISAFFNKKYSFIHKKMYPSF